MQQFILLVSSALLTFLIHFTTSNILPDQPETNALTPTPVLVCDRLADSLTLVTLYNATNGANWTNTWNLSQPIDTWYGVQLNPEGCVTCIDLDGNFDCDRNSPYPGNGLTGTLPDLNLPNLTYLNLQQNDISGPIPDFSGLPELETINLSTNAFNGPVPNFSNLTKLKILFLSSNDLSGGIPDFNNFPVLEWLNLRGNDLDGQIPDFSAMPELNAILLEDCQLSGPIPDFSNIPKLTRFWAYRNNLSGNIPDFSNTPLLETIFIEGNQLEGNVPDFSNLPNLDAINFGQNQLTGTIPDFSNVPKITGILLQDNQLTGSIPLFSNCPNLDGILLFGNNLTGTIPSFSDKPLLHFFEVGNNQLTGCLPDFSNAPEMRAIDVKNNNLSCPIPAYDYLTDLTRLEIAGNLLTFEDILTSYTSNSTLLEQYYTYTPQQKIYPDTTIGFQEGALLSIDLVIDDTVSTNVYTWYKNDQDYQTITGNNQLVFNNLAPGDAAIYRCEVTNPNVPDLVLSTGNITLSLVGLPSCRTPDSLALVDLYNATNGSNWTNTWDLTQPINTWYGIQLNLGGCVESLNLANNNLDGYIPDLNLPSLTFLSLAVGNFSDGIPDFSNLPLLKDLHLSGCDFNTALPDFSNLPNLEFLAVVESNLIGSIPSFVNSSKLRKIYLDKNNLTGSIPNFPNLPELTHFWTRENNLSGSIPDFSGCPKLKDLYLSNNNLSGSIPDFSNLPLLSNLWLSVNLLEGSIPNFTNLPALWILLINNNQLTGTIPDFNNLPKLRALILSDNQLESSIPDFSNLPQLEDLILSNNQLNGCLPKFNNSPLLNRITVSGNQLDCIIPLLDNLPALYNLDVRDNYLTFSDIVPNHDYLFNLTISNFGFYYYDSQRGIYVETPQVGTLGESFTVTLAMEDTLSNNRYHWHKDGAFYQTILGSKELTFDNLQLSDAGQYYCLINNSDARYLDLRSNIFTITIEEPNLPECEAEDLTLDQNPIPSDIYQVADTIKSTGIVEATADVTFIAGKTIRLLPNFHAEAGALFQAYIEDCELPAQARIQDLPQTIETVSLENQEHLALSIFPNPSSHRTNLQYQLPETSNVHIFISDLNGRIVQVIKAGENHDAGNHQLQINLSDLSGGIYNVHLLTPQEKVHRRMIIID